METQPVPLGLRVRDGRRACGSRICICEELEIDELVSFTSAVNVRSRRVMERLGMTRDPADDFDHPLVVEGSLRPHVLYRLPVGAWIASTEPPRPGDIPAQSGQK
jgi:hypothetical protein